MKTPCVLHIVDAMSIGGLERNVYQIFAHLRDKYDLALWCLYSGGHFADEIERLGVEVRVLPKKNWYNPFNLFWLARQMKQWRADIVHSHAYNANLFSRVASIIGGIPIRVAHLQNAHWLPSERGRRNVLIDKILSFKTAKIIACADSVREYTINEGINPRRIITIHNSVEFNEFNVQGNKAVLAIKKQEFGLRESDRVVGTVARLTYVKGHKYLLQAVPSVIAEFPDTKFLIVGDGPCRPELEEQAKQLKIDSHVIFTGTRTDVPDILALIDLFVLPSSIREGLPLVLAEAMACGKPTIATRIGGSAEIVRDGINGFIVPPKEPQPLAEKILCLLGHPDVAQKFGERGRCWCQQEYSSEIMADRFDQLYQSLL